jgi:hypothetical protein
MRGLLADGAWRGLRARGAGVACLRRFETVERRGMEARAGGAVHWPGLEWSGVEQALIGEVRPQSSRCVVESRFLRLIDGRGFGGNDKNVGAQKVGLTPGNLQAFSGR